MKRTRRKIMKIHRVSKIPRYLLIIVKRFRSNEQTSLNCVTFLLSSLTFIPFSSSRWIKSNKSSSLIELRFCVKHFYICLCLSLFSDKISKQFANLALWLSNRLIIFLSRTIDVINYLRYTMLHAYSLSRRPSVFCKSKMDATRDRFSSETFDALILSQLWRYIIQCLRVLSYNYVISTAMRFLIIARICLSSSSPCRSCLCLCVHFERIYFEQAESWVRFIPAMC